MGIIVARWPYLVWAHCVVWVSVCMWLIKVFPMVAHVLGKSEHCVIWESVGCGVFFLEKVGELRMKSFMDNHFFSHIQVWRRWRWSFVVFCVYVSLKILYNAC